MCLICYKKQEEEKWIDKEIDRQRKRNRLDVSTQKNCFFCLIRIQRGFVGESRSEKNEKTKVFADMKKKQVWKWKVGAEERKRGSTSSPPHPDVGPSYQAEMLLKKSIKSVKTFDPNKKEVADFNRTLLNENKYINFVWTRKLLLLLKKCKFFTLILARIFAK